MLETVKACIAELPDISFNEFYIQYMMAVQDVNIDLEIQMKLGKLSPSIKNVKSIDKLIHNTHEGLVNKDD